MTTTYDKPTLQKSTIGNSWQAIKHNLILLYTTVYALRTKKLSYRKDDRAMRPTYGCPEKFRESLSTAMAIFDEIFNGLLFRLIL